MFSWSIKQYHFTSELQIKQDITSLPILRSVFCGSMRCLFCSGSACKHVAIYCQIKCLIRHIFLDCQFPCKLTTHIAAVKLRCLTNQQRYCTTEVSKSSKSTLFCLVLAISCNFCLVIPKFIYFILSHEIIFIKYNTCENITFLDCLCVFLLRTISELQKLTTFLFVNENIKCGYSFS